MRFDWGLSGARAIAPGCDVAVVVDVLSFTTTLSVAMDAGIAVLPYSYDGEEASAYASSRGAVLAVGRSVAEAGRISLSPSTIRHIGTRPSSLVLPSPNGSTISYELAKSAPTVVGACLRNAHAVAGWISRTYTSDTRIAVIAAGERWPDGTLRPAWEDVWGAGSVLAELADLGWAAQFSAEAAVACDAWTAASSTIAPRLHASVSGRELIDAGYPEDVAIAAEQNTSSHVPVLRHGTFVPAL